MVRKLAIVAGLATLLGVGVAVAGTPFGGDDAGFIPPDKATEVCESAVGKIAGKYVTCVIKCHKARAKGKLVDDTQEDACERLNGGHGCEDKFNKVLNKLATKCPGSCAVANGPGLKALAESVLDGANGNVYCKSPSGAFLE
jgi:hypothetical protein